MKNFLQKLPIEGLLIVIVVLITLIVTIYLTKIDSIVDSHKKIIVTNISTSDENDALFVSGNDTDIDDQIVLNKPVPEKTEDIQEVQKKLRLFFIKVSDDGEIMLKSVLKSAYVGKSPLKVTIDKLLAGPDTQEINRGLLTLIPDGAEILSISIKDRVAYLNFNEMFRFNSLGVEGYIAQIKQIVYTTTEYDTVDSVQFSIDGAIQEYLGPEGVYIGRPISRDDLEL